MTRLARRLAAVLLALPLAMAAGAAPAQADVTVPGCYGAVVVVCNPTIEIGSPAGVEFYETQVPVCVGSCTWVTVILARTTPGEPLQVCYQHTSLSGQVTRHCTTEPGPINPPPVEPPPVEPLPVEPPSVDVDQLIANLERAVCRVYPCGQEIGVDLVVQAVCTAWNRLTGGYCAA